MFKTLYSILLALAATLTVTSCTDDRLWDDTEIGEGEAKITASISFKNFTPALDGSRAAGTALDGIPDDDVTAISGVSILQQRKAACSNALPIHLIYK